MLARTSPRSSTGAETGASPLGCEVPMAARWAGRDQGRKQADGVDARSSAPDVGLTMNAQPRPPRRVAASSVPLEDGSSFAVSPTDDDVAERTVGFLVADVDQALTELRAAGVATDDVSATDRHRYVHFRAPDGRLYELVQDLT